MSTPLETTWFDIGSLSWPVGVSSESAETTRQRAKEFSPDRQIPASFAWRDLLIEAIAEILQSCSVRNWDGYDAEPISHSLGQRAAELVRTLPEGIQRPTIVPEPDGDIAFEWHTKDNRLFSLSVTGTTLVYAGRFGGSFRQYGEEPFFGAIPRTILDIFARHFPAD